MSPVSDQNRPAFQAVADWMADVGGRYLLIGGLAAGFRGVARQTSDIDIVLLEDGQDEEMIARSARKHGFDFREGYHLEIARNRNLFALYHRAGQCPVDCSLGLLPFEVEAVERATQMDVYGVHLPVATTEDLVIQKFVAARPRDWDDIAELLRMNPLPTDLARIRNWCREFAEILEQPDRLARLEAIIAQSQ